MVDSKLWFQSKTVWGALLTIAASLATVLGYDISPADQANISDMLMAIIAAGGGLLSLYGRISASKRLG
ncbi:hypothetical protein [Pararhizobium sp.]|uniref:hypothetical protein n=1 Tax=Pararhizobium sp. TaxID=1977563 RepID=UPI00271D100E|nr:hypothetical protein [Pararhizobium sp.]MDO9417986.1 hypothetical protein [Pararhizobium sp.]